MNLLGCLLVKKRNKLLARKLLSNGDYQRGLLILKQFISNANASILAQVNCYISQNDLFSAAEVLRKANLSSTREITLNFLLEQLGRSAYKDGWEDAVPWLPERLYHFTDIENLPLILTSRKLMSWDLMTSSGIHPVKPGGDTQSRWRDHRLGLGNWIHLAVRAPHPMLFAAAKRIRRPVYFAFDSSLALQKSARFSDRNATDAGACIYEELNEFHEILNRINSGLHPAINKSSTQAEVLVEGSISLKTGVLTGILFRSRYELENAVTICPKETGLAELMRVDESVFG